jgi:HSP20 family protein
MGFRKGETSIIPGPPEELIERYLKQLLGQRGVSATLWDETDFPALDIYETPEQIVVEAELPGVKLEHLEVSISAGTMLIEGLKDEVLEPGRINFLCMERTFGTFRRMIPLIQSINPAKIKAVYRMGILQIQIPKAPEKRGQKKVIPVTVK